MAASEEATAPARLLVVDDDGAIRGLLTELMGEAGYTVGTAADGEEALRMAAESPPDLVLLDVAMPGMDGYEVCRRLLADLAGGRAPAIVFLTARADTTARVAGLDAGAVDYVLKPFEPVELEARIRAALRSKWERDALAAAAATDPLTGLANRGELDRRAAAAVALAKRHGRALAALLVDIDHFKEVNDTYGHAAGDAVLQAVARLMQEFVRASDLVARYGGEEFALLLPETDTAGALALAERLRQAVASTPVSVLPGLAAPPDAADPSGTAPGTVAGQDADGSRAPLAPAKLAAVPVRVSIGVATLQPAMLHAAALLAAADRALYQAKAHGRDRVEQAPVASPLPSPEPSALPPDQSVGSGLRTRD